MVNETSIEEILTQARQFYQAGDYSSAAQAYARASDLFSGNGDKLMSAEMKNNQAVALLRAKHAEEALEIVKGTDDIFLKAGDMRRQGMALANQASAMESLKRFDGAIGLYIKAGKALEAAGEDNLQIEVRQLLSSLYLRRLKILDAIIALQSGLAAVKNPTPRQRFMKKLLAFRL